MICHRQARSDSSAAYTSIAAPSHIGSVVAKLAPIASFGTWLRASARKKKVQPSPVVIWMMRAVNSKRLGADPSEKTLATDGFENLDGRPGCYATAVG